MAHLAMELLSFDPLIAQSQVLESNFMLKKETLIQGIVRNVWPRDYFFEHIYLQ